MIANDEIIQRLSEISEKYQMDKSDADLLGSAALKLASLQSSLRKEFDRNADDLRTIMIMLKHYA